MGWSRNQSVWLTEAQYASSSWAAMVDPDLIKGRTHTHIHTPQVATVKNGRLNAKQVAPSGPTKRSLKRSQS